MFHLRLCLNCYELSHAVTVSFFRARENEKVVQFPTLISIFSRSIFSDIVSINRLILWYPYVEKEKGYRLVAWNYRFSVLFLLFVL
jgi:hypothetical protein